MERSEKELKKREQILNGNILKAILMIALPILFYNLCNYLYGIYDMMVVKKAGIGDAADIVVLDQIKNMISTVGGALATGGGILISRRYGAKDIDGAKRCSNTLFSLALIITGITFIFIPIGKPFLLLLQTDSTTIENAMGYYNVQIIILMITTMNNTFIAIEKSKGNTFKLVILNLGVIFIKVGLSTLFAFGPFENVTVTWLAVATMLAQLFMFGFGIVFCFIPTNVLRISIKSLNLDRENCLGIFKLALPVFIGRFLFSFGKVYVNSSATSVYGKMCVGALGISNTMAGLITNCVNSFEDAGSTIVSQNYGNSNGKRIQKFFFINLAVLSVLSLTGSITMFILKENIASFFAGNDLEYKEMIVNIFKWECMDLFFSGLSAAAASYFYGFGMTKITMALSMSTLFAFRIPTLVILMYAVKMNYEACGIAMFVSNTLSGIIAIIIALVMVLRLPKSKKYKNLFEAEA